MKWAHEGLPRMTVGMLIEALSKCPADAAVLINGSIPTDDGEQITYAQRIFQVEIGYADTSYDMNWDLTFSSRRFHDSEVAVRILGCDDGPDKGAVVIHNGVHPDQIKDH